MSLLAEVLENDGIGFTLSSGEGATQPKATSISCSDTEAGDGIGTHASLDYRVFNTNEFGKSGFDHCLSLLSK